MPSSLSQDIVVQSTLRRYLVNSRRIHTIMQTVGSHCGLASFQVNVAFVAPSRMRELNKRFRNKDRSTDVLSFPIQSWSEPIKIRSVAIRPTNDPVPNPLGDIVISLEDANRNADTIGQPLNREVCFLLIHGFLHLCGHDHMNAKEEKIMLSAQRRLLRRLESGKQPMWVRLVSHVKSRHSATNRKTSF